MNTRDTDSLKYVASQGRKDILKDILVFILLAVIIVTPIRTFIAKPFIVSGASMMPTFEGGEYLIVDQMTYKFHEPQRGDVVIFKFPEDPSRFFIKRIIGLPGETVVIKGKDILVGEDIDNLRTLTEPYVEIMRETHSTVTLDGDEYFVMGDNRLVSLDSRAWGPLKEEYIVGRAFIRLLPINKLNHLPGQFTEY